MGSAFISGIMGREKIRPAWPLTDKHRVPEIFLNLTFNCLQVVFSFSFFKKSIDNTLTSLKIEA